MRSDEATGPGVLVAIEGVEGSGKTTLHARLARRLEAAGCAVVACREPGGTPLGDELRRLLLASAHTPAHATEALLFLASRAELFAHVVRPALAAGKVVILDRYLLSTLAYQVAGRGLPAEPIFAGNALAVGAVVPVLTLLLDLPFDEGLRRARARGVPDRLEREGDAFHHRVARYYADAVDPAWLAQHPAIGPLVRLDATLTPDALEVAALQALARVGVGAPASVGVA